MNLRPIMSSRVVTVELDDSLETVKGIFDSARFHHLLVVGSDKKLLGVISDRDLLRAISPYVGTLAEQARDLATLRKRVHQIMTREPITLPPESSVQDAIRPVPRASRVMHSYRGRALQACRHRDLERYSKVACARLEQLSRCRATRVVPFGPDRYVPAGAGSNFASSYYIPHRRRTGQPPNPARLPI